VPLLERAMAEKRGFVIGFEGPGRELLAFGLVGGFFFGFGFGFGLVRLGVDFGLLLGAGCATTSFGMYWPPM
jgi:hypothetical protein